jgi:hypothetical protein
VKSSRKRLVQRERLGCAIESTLLWERLSSREPFCFVGNSSRLTPPSRDASKSRSQSQKIKSDSVFSLVFLQISNNGYLFNSQGKVYHHLNLHYRPPI